jgi:hypothetical protein
MRCSAERNKAAEAEALEEQGRELRGLGGDRRTEALLKDAMRLAHPTQYSLSCYAGVISPCGRVSRGVGAQ